ncbi:uncharacterized protein Nmag_1612 [Natrialba magadii ATCC 43099]|uniref:Uncharacterized protein n=1 Tax=Natrialba magadii (strain ATCC 43099 / DSM 3394 / CCM 3739 / CIP 104546 / IAM 13178 / JCM 8861 / NBRC 102185 / NCIMB 2190 / MS3) TaxID=547559 RepID=D3SUD0_NATMM|nr:hypothetical protein [Natrialba magadii]ADD05188.1 uncharacterized protein Nmag_1612 [Natrialba magadii ATCC 43099]ELY23226.1 hypothetical protein C500_20591 [Natrialba magadii ATCC 43099]
MNTDTNDADNADGSNSTTSPYFDSVINRANTPTTPEDALSAAINAAATVAAHSDRLESDLTDEDAARLNRLRIAQAFDDAEARHQEPEPLSGGPATGACQYCVEGTTATEWLTTNHAVNLEERR